MIFKFRIISDEVKDFAREMLISGGHTFLDFHHCLQEDLGYDPKQLASFFITNASWEKKLQITLLDMMDEESENVITMDTAILNEHIKEAGQRMLYVYDFFSERSFFIELTEVIEIGNKKTDPKIIFSNGEPPLQIDLSFTNIAFPADDFDSEINTESYGDDFLDENDYIDTDDFSDD